MGGKGKSKNFGKKNCCPNCDKIFKDTLELDIHLLDVKHPPKEEEKEEIYKCIKCEKVFHSSGGLNAHMKSYVHKNN